MSEIKNDPLGLPNRVPGTRISDSSTEIFRSLPDSLVMEGDFGRMAIDGRPPLMDRQQVHETYGMNHGDLLASVVLPERLHYDIDNPAPVGVELLVFDARANKSQPPYYKVISSEDAAYLQRIPKRLRGLVAGVRSLVKEVRAGQPLLVGKEEGRWMPKDFWRSERQQADRDIISRKQTSFSIDESYNLVIESEGKNRDLITLNVSPEEKVRQEFLDGAIKREDERLHREHIASKEAPRHAVWPGSTTRPERVGRHRKEHSASHARTYRHLGSTTIPK